MNVIQVEQHQDLDHDFGTVHVIPSERDESLTANCVQVDGTRSINSAPKRKRATMENNVFQSFSHASLVARNIGTSILKCESAMINQRLMKLQGAELEQAAPNTPQNDPVCKKRRIEDSISESSGVPSDDDLDETTNDTRQAQQEARLAANDKEMVSLERQADRIKRMSDLLRQLEDTQKLFLDDMIACAEDYNERKAM